MTIHRFFIPKIQPDGNTIIFPAEVSHQIAKVLRLERGDVVVIFDSNKNEYTIMLEEVNREAVKGRVIKQGKNTAEPIVTISLYQSLLPREKFEEVLQKGTEVGVSSFFPIETARTIIKAKDIREEKQERWQKITQEAAEQSERGVVPDVHQSFYFQEAIEQASKEGVVLIAWEEDQKNFPSMVLPKLSQDKKIALFIGPEGGFTQEEIDFAKSKGAQTVSLGPRILRSETAGVVLASLVLFAIGDLDKPTK